MTTLRLLGDSQMQGLVFLGDLADKLRGWTYAGATYQSGASSVRLRTLYQGDQIPAQVVVIAAGGNDTERSQAAWGALVDVVRGSGVQTIFWVTPPAAVGDAALDAERARIAEAQRAFLSRYSFVRVLSGRALAQGLPRRDRVHLTPAGYQAFASRLASVLVPVRSSTSRTVAWLLTGAAVLGIGYLVMGGSR